MGRGSRPPLGFGQGSGGLCHLSLHAATDLHFVWEMAAGASTDAVTTPPPPPCMWSELQPPNPRQGQNLVFSPPSSQLITRVCAQPY